MDEAKALADDKENLGMGVTQLATVRRRAIKNKKRGILERAEEKM